jgi:4-amino-4-deoxy-L-arabinose transferase-like glycosyltransferase
MGGVFEGLTATPAKGGLTARGWIVLMLLAVAALAPGLFSIPAMDRDESRYAQASRQMMESGDYINIRLQDVDRHKQPAATYWLQALASQPFGGADAPIGAHRLPGFVFALFAVAATAWLGARMFSPAAGLTAGLILATTLVLAVEARTAKTDAILLGVGMIAQCALMILMVEVKARRPAFIGWPAVMWAALGATLLIKGPIFFMVTALTLIVFAAWKRDPGLLLKVRPLPGVLLALAIFTPWFIAINLETDWDFARTAIGYSMLDKVGEAQEAHSGPLGFHLVATLFTLWPGIALLPLGVLAAWRMRGEDRVKFLIAWILPTYVVFELVATKLPHYTLPSYPAVALLIALGLAQAGDLLASGRMKIVHGVFAVIAIAVALLLGAVPVGGSLYLGEAPDLAAWLSIGFGVLVAGAIAALALKPSGGRLLGTSVAAAALYTCVFGVAIPNVDRLWPSERAGRLVDQITGCETLTLATSGYEEPSNMVNLGTNVALTNTPEEAADVLLSDPRCGLAIVDARGLVEFDARVEEAGGELRSLATLEGHNAVKGDDLLLGFYTLEGSDLSLPPR